MISTSSLYNTQPAPTPSPTPVQEAVSEVLNTPTSTDTLGTNKTLDVSDIKDAQEKISDINVVGNGDLWQLLCKASSPSQDWMKSTKAMEIPDVGCLVQVTTQQYNNVAEALHFVKNVRIVDDVNGGRKLESIRNDNTYQAFFGKNKTSPVK